MSGALKRKGCPLARQCSCEASEKTPLGNNHPQIKGDQGADPKIAQIITMLRNLPVLTRTYHD
eukprot:3828106-Pyramimonas_sp.AAC.2